jgi:DNA-directed RNA polymerase specialized sigma24 family protein
MTTTFRRRPRTRADRAALVESVRPWVLERSAYYARAFRLDREEVRQEAFLKLWKQSARYDPARSSPAHWAELVCRSVAGNERAKARAECRSATAVPLGPNDRPHDDPTPDRRAEVVLDVLGDCPEAWALVYRHGLDGLGRVRTHREVGEVLGVGLNAATHLVGKAYRRLAKMEAAGAVPY